MGSGNVDYRLQREGPSALGLIFTKEINRVAETAKAAVILQRENTYIYVILGLLNIFMAQ